MIQPLKKLLPLFCLISTLVHGQMTVEVYTSKITGEKVQYLKYFPENYDKTKKYPILINMHGDGEKANKGIEVLKTAGINRAIYNGTKIPFIVISPQCGYTNFDQIGRDNVNRPGQFITEALDTALARYNGDPNRCYIAGLSMGGVSVYNALAYFPNKYAAGLCIASWPPDLKEASKIVAPMWDAKFDNDPISTNPDYAIMFLQNMQSKASSRYTVIRGDGHGLWDQIYANAWMGMTIAPKWPNSTRPSNVYEWFAQFSLNTVVNPNPDPNPNPNPNPPPSVTGPKGYLKQVPGVLEAEGFTTMKGIATEPCAEGGQDVGFIDATDYLDYNLKVAAAGSFTMQVRYAGSGELQIKDAAGTVLNTVSLSATGGWQTWKSASAKITLKEGYQTLRVYVTKGGFNLNYLDFSQRPL